MDEGFIARRHSNFTFLFLFAISIFLLTAHLSSSVQIIKNFIFYAISPSTKTAAKIIQSGYGVLGNITEIVKDHQENIVLRKTVRKYIVLEQDFRRVEAENARLRQLVGFPAFTHYKSLPARVINREPESWFQWMIIDRGRNDGVVFDAAVIVWENNSPAVLGRVGELYEHSAKVILLSNIMSAMPAVTMASQDDGLIEGQNGPAIKLNYLLPDRKILIGDEVVTNSLSSVFPPNIKIGKIIDVDFSGNEQFQSALIKPFAGLHHLREVVILIPEKQIAD